MIIMISVEMFPLPGLESEPSDLPFAYSLYDVLFFLCSKMTIDLLENFQAKNLYFQGWLLIILGPPNTFFLENALEKTLLNIFSNFLYLHLKVQSCRLIMENNFIQSLHNRSNF